LEKEVEYNFVLMVERKYFPEEKYLGKYCQFWDFDGRFIGCNYPKAEMEGRVSCEGIVDEMCLFLKDGRMPKSVSADVLSRLKIQPPSLGPKPYIPASDTRS